MAEEKAQVAVSGNVMFYQNPQPLSQDKHSKHGVKQVENPLHSWKISIFFR